MTDATVIIVTTAITGTIAGAIAAIPGIIAALRVEKVRGEVREVKHIVDGPLSLALRSNAELAQKYATVTGKPEDIIAAAKASILNDNREAGKLEAQMKPE